MPDIQGLNPMILWYTLAGVVGLCLIFIIGYNVYNAIHTIRERHLQKKEAEKPDLADKISVKVLEKIEPRLKEIEDKLDKDKSRLDNHEKLIADVQSNQADIRNGMVAICQTLVVLITYGNLGDSKEVKEATASLHKFLAGKIVK